MKKYLIIILIFFLFFIIDFRRVDANIDLTTCNYYMNGVCQSSYYFDSFQEEIESTTVPITETIKETQTIGGEATTQYFNLVVQFFGISILFILLVIVLESVLQPK